MSVLQGPRKEARHVVKDGRTYWVEFKDGKIVFGDGRTCGEDEVVHLPPCEPTMIICVHVNYVSRYYEFNNTRTPPKDAGSMLRVKGMDGACPTSSRHPDTGGHHGCDQSR
jgi:hypothetical protein